MSVTYDPSVDVLEVKFREGRVKHTLSGIGEFIIYVDEDGAFWIIIVVHKWDSEPKVDELKKIGVRVLE